MKTRLNIALILSGAILFFATSIMKAQSSTVKPERGLEVKTQNAGSAQFLKVTSNNNIVSYDFTMNAQEDMSINENNVGSRIYIKRGGNKVMETKQMVLTH
ncbi:MAG: hypothetical protein AAFO82_17305 [Bacteroidota bacterium]